MKKSILTTALIALFANVLTAQSVQTLSLDDFTKITIRNSLNVVLVQSDESKIVTSKNFRLPQNLTLEDIITVENGALTVAFPQLPPSTSRFDFNDRKAPKRGEIIIHFKSLESLVARGSSRVRSQGRISTEQLQIVVTNASRATLEVHSQLLTSTVSGSSYLTLSGTTQKWNLKTTNSSDVSARTLITQHTSICLTNSSRATVFAQNISGTVTGASRLSHNPTAESSVRASASSRVRW